MDYVDEIGEFSVHLLARSTTTIAVIKELGGTSGVVAETWRINYDSEDELAGILQRLINAEVAFASGGSGWPPAAVAEWLREKGKIQGTIKELSWSGPEHMIVRQI